MTLMISAAFLFTSAPKVSAQGYWTETTYEDFIDSEEFEFINVSLTGPGDDANLELATVEAFSWVNMSTPGAPPIRDDFAVAYDEYNQVLVMFGGSDFNFHLNKRVFFDDTWEYSYSANTWTNITDPTKKPPPRWYHKMVYDSYNKVIVMFGGSFFDPFIPIYVTYNDTWEYDVATKEWNQVFPSSKPSARTEYAMSYYDDGVNRKTILFGGHTGMLTTWNDTWAYDSTNDSWQQMSTIKKPPKRFIHDMAFNSKRNVLVMYGGYSFSGMNPIPLLDTWEYTYPNTWKEIKGLIPVPGERGAHAMVYHKYFNWTILFGGGPEDDIWAYDSDLVMWFSPILHPLSPTPGARGEHGMVYDSTHDVILLFDGVGLNDTWALEITDVYNWGGYMISSPCDSGELPPKPNWEFIYWNPVSQPPDAHVRMQLANSTDGVNWGGFVGPDGTNTSFYTNGAGEFIWSGHSGSQYLRYKAILSTGTRLYTPKVDDVTITWATVITRPRNLVVERSPPNNVTLKWNPVPGAIEYRIYETQDRFTLWPWPLLATVFAPQASYTAENHLVDGLDHFYIVRAFDGFVESGNSTMGTKVHLHFLSASHKYITDINWFSLPYKSIYKKASDIANELTHTKIRVIGKWIPEKQRAITYTYVKGMWKGIDFPIDPGDGIFIAGIQNSFDWIITGSDKGVTLDFNYYPGDNRNINWISIPYTGIYKRASSIVGDIEGGLSKPSKVIEVAKWIPTTQTYEIYYWDGSMWRGSNFSIKSGDAVYIKIISNFNWSIVLLTPAIP